MRVGHVVMVFQVIVPIFFLLALGYSSVKLKLLNQEQVKAVGAFVLKIALPALLLQSLAARDLHEIWLPEFFIIYTLATLILFISAFFVVTHYFKNNRIHASILSLGASMSNTGLIGTAVLSLLMGHKAMTYISLVVIVECVLLIPAVLLLIQLSTQESVSIGKMVKEVFLTLLTSPIFMSVLIGISLSFLDLQIPHLIDQSLALLGQAASPLALFSIGGGIVGMSLKYINVQSFYLVASNNLLMPLLVFLGLSYVTDASDEMIFAGTVIAALPMPTIFGMLGQAYGANDKAMTPLLISTIFGFAVTSLIIAMW